MTEIEQAERRSFAQAIAKQHAQDTKGEANSNVRTSAQDVSQVQVAQLHREYEADREAQRNEGLEG